MLNFYSAVTIYDYRRYDFYRDILELSYHIFIAIIPVRDDIFVWHFCTASTIDSLLVYLSFSTLCYMPPLTANDVQRVIARPWESSVSVSTKYRHNCF